MDFSKHLSSLVDTACDIHEEDFIASEEESKSNSDRNTKLIKYLAEIEAATLQNTSKIESEERIKIAEINLEAKLSKERENLFSIVTKAVESQAEILTKSSVEATNILFDALNKLTEAISKNSQPKSCLVSIQRDENGDASSMIIKQGITS